MKLILEPATTEIEIKKSKFICNIKPVRTEDEAQEFIKKIKKIHHKATHNVPVYLIGDSHEIQRYSDDGEPAGTAGLPVLRMIMQEGVSNLALVISRYFGGIKLGTGGLVRAYTQSAKISLEEAGLSELVELYLINFSINYTHQAKIEHDLKSYEHYIKEVVYTDKVEFKLFMRQNDIKKFEELLQELNSGLPNDYYCSLIKGIIRDGKVIEIK